MEKSAVEWTATIEREELINTIYEGSSSSKVDII